MDLTSLTTGVHTRKLKKRVGRGIGSGHGKTASRGHKGQYSSAGANMPGQLFIGGQTPLHRRVPKRGFSNATWAKVYAIVNIGDLECFEDGTKIDLALLKSKGIVNGTWDGLRVLGDGELTKKNLVITANHFTASAKAKIEALGGTVSLIAPPKKPVRAKMGQGKNSAKKKPAN
jgi:large subunit ribosomal protein L15